MVLSGVLWILSGATVIASLCAGLMSIAWLIGFWPIAFDVLLIILAFRLRKAAH